MVDLVPGLIPCKILYSQVMCTDKIYIMLI